jgi:hypothetical protein
LNIVCKSLYDIYDFYTQPTSISLAQSNRTIDQLDGISSITTTILPPFSGQTTFKMQFINSLLFAASTLATIVSAENMVMFVNQNSETRNVVFTANAGLEQLEPVQIQGLDTYNQTFPTGWIGNFYSYNEGAENVPGMLGEVRFDGFAEQLYFDVSSIVNNEDTSGVKMLYPLNENPKSSTAKVSGCLHKNCKNQYNAPDDIATQSTSSSALVCLLGEPEVVERRRKVELFSRDYVTGAI